MCRNDTLHTLHILYIIYNKCKYIFRLKHTLYTWTCIEFWCYLLVWNPICACTQKSAGKQSIQTQVTCTEDYAYTHRKGSLEKDKEEK